MAVVCGKGNNGGDGLVAARLLREAGREVRVLLLGDPDELTAMPRTSSGASRLPTAGAGAPVAARVERRPSCSTAPPSIVDAVLGTGFAGAPREPALRRDRGDQRGRAPVVAADVPCGVDASTGEVAGAAVRAAATATFHAAKPGLWIEPGKAHAGEVRGGRHRHPAGRAAREPTVGLIGDGRARRDPAPRRDSTKFASGHVLVCGGSRGLTGRAVHGRARRRCAPAPATSRPACPRSLETIFDDAAARGR